jgi:hypothetical protein
MGEDEFKREMGRYNRMAQLKVGQIYRHSEQVNIYARIDEIQVNEDEAVAPNILFSVRDNRHPENDWAGGAGLDSHTFTSLYGVGPIENMRKPTADRPLKFRIVATYEYEPKPELYRKGGFGDSPTVDEMIAIDREEMWELMYQEMGEGDKVKLRIEVVEGE